ncbi:GAF domain-containing protein [Paenibacillus chartarius]|uniref:GAF domain-containing protein n=1 Tax=Paenibacillus chartarius TaxID=747481 RepID=A0ABV6DHS4_9BACL
MSELERAIAVEVDLLRSGTSSDYAAYAAPIPGEPLWRWRGMSGSISQRTALLAVRPGRGIAGAVIKTGRTIVLGRHRNEADLRKEDALLLETERLVAAAAVPVNVSGVTQGLLLIASREPRDYDADDMMRLNAAAEALAAMSGSHSPIK